MEFNPNFTYMLQSATAEDNVCHCCWLYKVIRGK
jgi:hypothetical protein